MFSLKSYLSKISYYLCLFFYFYPEKYTFMPCSTIAIIQIIALLFGTVYFIKHNIPLSFFKVIISGCVIFIIGFIASNILNSYGDLDTAKRGILIISYVFSSLFLVYLFKRSHINISTTSLLKSLIVITVIQAFISLIFFFLPNIAEIYRSFVVSEEFKSDMIEKVSSYRLIGIGDVRFATGAVHYGIILWALIVLMKLGTAYSTIKNNFLIILFSIVGIMSGRVFFLFIVVTFFFIWYLNGNIKKGTSEFIKTFFLTFIILSIAFVYLLSQYEELINWAFEFFIKYGEGNTFESDSTNELQAMYKFPNDFKTWIVGDGKSTNENGGFYMNSDVGYIRSIFYWGIFGSLIYYGVQIYFYKIFKSLSPNSIMKKYFLFLILWLFIYSFKDFYSIEKFLVLFIVAQFYIKHDEPKHLYFNCDTCI